MTSIGAPAGTDRSWRRPATLGAVAHTAAIAVALAVYAYVPRVCPGTWEHDRATYGVLAGLLAGVLLSALGALFTAGGAADRRRFAIAVGTALLISFPLAWFGAGLLGIVSALVVAAVTGGAMQDGNLGYIVFAPLIGLVVGAVAGAGSTTFLRHPTMVGVSLLLACMGGLFLLAGQQLWQ